VAVAATATVAVAATATVAVALPLVDDEGGGGPALVDDEGRVAPTLVDDDTRLDRRCPRPHRIADVTV
jgi:hypothetical protein